MDKGQVLVTIDRACQNQQGAAFNKSRFVKTQRGSRSLPPAHMQVDCSSALGTLLVQGETYSKPPQLTAMLAQRRLLAHRGGRGLLPSS